MEKQITFEESDAILLVDCAHGQYMYQIFGQWLMDAITAGTATTDISPEQLKILCEGPDNPDYLDTVNDCDGSEVVTIEKYIVYFGADIWAIPAEQYEQIDWDEIP